jgi:hypothetical protein
MASILLIILAEIVLLCFVCINIYLLNKYWYHKQPAYKWILFVFLIFFVSNIVFLLFNYYVHPLKLFFFSLIIVILSLIVVYKMTRAHRFLFLLLLLVIFIILVLIISSSVKNLLLAIAYIVLLLITEILIFIAFLIRLEKVESLIETD